MIKLKYNFHIVKIICKGCLNTNTDIVLEYKNTETFKRSVGNEENYIYYGDKHCGQCGDKLKIIVTATEYPKGILNNIEVLHDGLYLSENIDVEIFEVI